MSEQRKKTQNDGGASLGIAWTEQTWNPVMGCSKVSAGCKNCYAEKMASRFSGEGQPFHGLSDGKRWTGAVRFRADRLMEPLRWTRPRLVFVNSVSDLFHEELPFELIAAVFGVMSLAKAHTFQVLTKRPARMLEFFAWLDAKARAKADDVPILTLDQARFERLWECVADIVPNIRGRIGSYPAWPLPNVWLGVSTEDQAAADERIPLLLKAPAAVRWISAEPLIGRLDLQKWLRGVCPACGSTTYPDDHDLEMACQTCATLRPDDEAFDDWPVRLDWVVVGGESGPGARPCEGSWMRFIVRDCQRKGVPVFVKQLGAAYSDPFHGIAGRALVIDPDAQALVSRRLAHPKGGDVSEWPTELRVREWPKGYNPDGSSGAKI